MMKNDRNNDSIPRASSKPDALPVNWFVTLSPNLSVFSSLTLNWAMRSLSLICLGAGLQFAFPQATTATAADCRLNVQSTHSQSSDFQSINFQANESSLALVDRSMAIASDSQLLCQTLNDEVNNEDPDLTGQPGTPERTQGSGTR